MIYGTDCADVRIASMEVNERLCFDHALDPCVMIELPREPGKFEQNCRSNISWQFGVNEGELGTPLTVEECTP